jgi:hypothetical protein
MIENEPGCKGTRHEHRNPRSTQTQFLSAESTAEELG